MSAESPQAGPIVGPPSRTWGPRMA
jgi:hypothetical protein